jgi:hypothetical protein
MSTTTGSAGTRPAPEPRWRLTEHVCRHCLGRLLERRAGRMVIVRCAKCGAEAKGCHEALCCCGIVVNGQGRMFECIRNPGPTPEFPAEIVMRERPWAPPAVERRPRKLVHVPEPWEGIQP